MCGEAAAGGVPWNAVSAGAACISALAAAVATYLALLGLREHRTGVLKQRRQEHYDRVVADPIVRDTPCFVNESLEMMRKAEAGVPRDCVTPELHTYVRDTTQSWLREYRKHAGNFSMRVAAWGDPVLQRALRDLNDALEDQVTQEIEKFCTPTRPEFSPIFREYATRVVAAVLQYDPSTAD